MVAMIFGKISPYVRTGFIKVTYSLGRFEGTIRSDYHLWEEAIPALNAPEAVVPAIKDAGYQVVDRPIIIYGTQGLVESFTTLQKPLRNHRIES